MKLIPYDKKNLGGINCYKKPRNLAVIEKFIESGLDCAEIKDYTHKSATSFQTSFYSTIRRFKINTVKVVIRKERVFLIRIDESES